MTQEMVVRRSPIVLIRNFALIEAAALIAYFLSLGGGSAKYELYSSLFIAGFLPYDTAKVLFLSGVQFLIMVFAFLGWYYERYLIRPNLLVHERGALLRRRDEVSITQAPHIRLTTGFFEKLFRAGTLTINAGGAAPFVLRTISSYRRLFADIAHVVRASSGARPPLATLLAADENILVVAHSIVISCFRMRVERLEEHEMLRVMEQEPLENCGIAIFESQPAAGGRLALIEWNTLAYEKQTEGELKPYY